MVKNNKVTKNILPINKTPMLNSYAHYSYSMAIIDNPMVYEETDAVYEEIYINKGFPISEAAVLGTAYINTALNGKTKLSYNINDQEKHSYTYHKVSGNCCYCVKIEYLKSVNITSEIGIMICNTAPVHYTNNNQDMIKVFFSADEKIHFRMYLDKVLNKSNNLFNVKLPIWIRVLQNEKYLFFEVSSDNKAWDEIIKISFNLNDEYYIGVYHEPKIYSFYNWVYSNFIQLHCDKYLNTTKESTDIELDFFNGFKTRGNYLINNPFVFTECIERQELLQLSNINDFIKSSIDGKKYIQLLLNENFIPNRGAYGQFDFAHINLIYGYDLDDEKYFLMGYDPAGSFSSSEMSFLQMENAVSIGVPGNDKLSEDYIVRISRSDPEFNYDLNINIIIEFMLDYINSNNSYEKCSFMNAIPLNRVFGLSVYDCIVNYYTPLFKRAGVRIFHTLLEHKGLMLKRISYFYKEEVLTLEQYNQLHDLFEEIFNKVRILKSIHMKYTETKKDFVKTSCKIKNLLLTIKHDEEIAYRKFASILSGYRLARNNG